MYDWYILILTIRYNKEWLTEPKWMWFLKERNASAKEWLSGFDGERYFLTREGKYSILYMFYFLFPHASSCKAAYARNVNHADIALFHVKEGVWRKHQLVTEEQKKKRFRSSSEMSWHSTMARRKYFSSTRRQWLLLYIHTHTQKGQWKRSAQPCDKSDLNY